MDDVGIPEVPWELTIDPEHLEHPGKLSDKGFTTGFEHLGWYSIWSRSLACLQLFDGCILASTTKGNGRQNIDTDMRPYGKESLSFVLLNDTWSQ